MREADPSTGQLLAEVERLEAEPWPAVMPAYVAVIAQLATRCEARSGRAAVYRWARRRLGMVLTSGELRWREAINDALHDLVAQSAGWLWRYRAGVGPRRPPRLRAAIVRWLRWRASDLILARHRRHERGRALVVPELVGPNDPCAAALLRQVLALLDLDDHRHRALALVAIGHSVAEAARRTGASRQQVYRARVELLIRCGLDDEQ